MELVLFLIGAQNKVMEQKTEQYFIVEYINWATCDFEAADEKSDPISIWIKLKVQHFYFYLIVEVKLWR